MTAVAILVYYALLHTRAQKRLVLHIALILAISLHRWHLPHAGQGLVQHVLLYFGYTILADKDLASLDRQVFLFLFLFHLLIRLVSAILAVVEDVQAVFLVIL